MKSEMSMMAKLYPKNESMTLSEELFRQPGSEYRAAPFWAWNCELEQEELLWQIDRLKEMGYGGFHMHSRAGLGTEYLGPDFMDCVRACVEHAEKNQMKAWLYDEDRWPSGFAGGLVTADPRYRQKMLLFTVNPLPEATDPQTGLREGRPYLLACFDILLDEKGFLKHYPLIAPEAEAVGRKWYVYVKTAELSARYNHYCYVDTLCPEAVDAFLESTHERYRQAVGDRFGTTVPAIFTDEPQVRYSPALDSSFSADDTQLAWTTDFAESFRQSCGFDLIPHLPELLWELPEGQFSKARYHYRDHVCERFTSAYCDRIGAWCEKNGIALMGHIISEDRLGSQTRQTGECMRNYRSFTVPGIDMLCDIPEFATAKQCQSAVHQYGREAMMSELYGVTGWDFDFRGHKFQGDWQAALGVTVRVPHLAWVSMKGKAKRDYPGSLHYQASWYREYGYVEDHFARLNTALTRGKPRVRVALLHPIESFWLSLGPKDLSSRRCEEQEENFSSVISWLLGGTIDFDLFAESALPSLYQAAEEGFTVGAMRYEAVVIPPVVTLRSSTLSILSDFSARGGRIIVMGEPPVCVDAECSDAALPLWQKAKRIAFSPNALLESLSGQRDLALSEEDGTAPSDFVYQLRDEADASWLFLAHSRKDENAALNGAGRRIRISLRGLYRPELYDTVNGRILPMAFRAENGRTELSQLLYAQDSLLIRLKPLEAAASAEEIRGEERFESENLSLCQELVVGEGDVAEAPSEQGPVYRDGVRYTLSEPNVLVLDMAEYSLDGLHFESTEELLRIDTALRVKAYAGIADVNSAQPWTEGPIQKDFDVYLRFRFNSRIACSARLAYEEADEIILNGERVEPQPDGYFTDRSILTAPLPPIREGENVLLIRAPFGRRISLENYFLLGEFGVSVFGSRAELCALPERIPFGDLTRYGFPFYGGAVSYELPIELEEDGRLSVTVPQYAGAVIKAKLDGCEAGYRAYAPYRLELGRLSKGSHRLSLTLFLSRINCFGALHESVRHVWKGSNIWYTKGSEWAYEYQLTPTGLLCAPKIEAEA